MKFEILSDAFPARLQCLDRPFAAKEPGGDAPAGTGLGAIGLFLYDPPKKAGYSQTPMNSVTFASIGVDGDGGGSS